MLFADVADPPQNIVTALEHFFTQPVGIALILIVAFIVGLFAYFHHRRERLLRHQERIAMIQAGIHPDYPPEEPPSSSKADGGPASKETTDFRPT
jgi:hypothetical protein